MFHWLDKDPVVWLLTAATLAPLLGFIVLLFAGRRFGRKAGWVGTAAIGIAAVCALTAAFNWHHASEGPKDALDLLIPWMNVSDNLTISVGVHVDGLTIAMCAMVTVVATMIHVFSTGYMADDSRYSRFFAFLNLFCFSMLGLVIGSTLMTMFIFWELVGLCSYLLIGFWFEKKSASNAAIKAFVVNRIGDFGFILGVAGAFFWLGAEWAAAHPGVQVNLTIAQMAQFGHELINGAGGPPAWLTVIGLLLFCGAIGKSAQFPLHVWLPDAMEGPTPVSALIHAATMVAAGVYMVGRVYGLLTPDALLVIAAIGLITLTMAALIAITQTDIKRVLAYSTVSQLGYMVLALGIGGYVSGLFHLITHAFFKALLFLGSGAVIYACHHEQDVRKMGGLAKAIPITCWTFFIATLAIAGFPFTSGYFSKDMILGNAADYAMGTHGAVTAGAGQAVAWLFFLVPMAIAYVTAFYMFRVWWLTFFSRSRDHHVLEHAQHNGEPKAMAIPLLVLAVGALIVGYGWMPFGHWIESTCPEGAWGTVFEHGQHMSEHAEHLIMLPALLAGVVGFALAWLIYRNGFDVATRIRSRIEPLYQLVHNKFYFDELYDAVFVRATMLLCNLSNLWDKYVIDGLVNLSSRVVHKLAIVSGWFDNRAIDGAANGLASADVGVRASGPGTANGQGPQLRDVHGLRRGDCDWRGGVLGQLKTG